MRKMAERLSAVEASVEMKVARMDLTMDRRVVRIPSINPGEAGLLFVVVASLSWVAGSGSFPLLCCARPFSSMPSPSGRFPFMDS